MLGLAMIVAILAGALTYWKERSWPSACLAAGAAFGASALFFNALIG